MVFMMNSVSYIVGETTLRTLLTEDGIKPDEVQIESLLVDEWACH